MANTKSAEKRNRQAQKRRVRNVTVRTQVKSAVKKARDTKDSSTLRGAFSALDKAASKGVLHKRTAARRISRLAKAANKAAKA